MDLQASTFDTVDLSRRFEVSRFLDFLTLAVLTISDWACVRTVDVLTVRISGMGTNGADGERTRLRDRKGVWKRPRARP